MTATRQLHCAIYTRKSTEEGLDQTFNSLQAQREACEAYVASQRHEGWQLLPARYDDGGFSGGSMDRPALKKLLAEVITGRVNIVLVYKVDRLTRSLADFAKIIEIFDSHGASFVSVTQQFNTTSSMGRLTLNVLLSFAQFEREVGAERTRDKIAASKKKGMWMGGFVPLGYDLESRKLIVNPEEATVVQEIFRQYIRLGGVSQLREYLQEHQIYSKLRRRASGEVTGGNPYSRGALYQILKNRLYIGEIEHHGNIYPGQHDGIIDQETWDKTTALLREHNRGQRRQGMPPTSSLLAGILVDVAGNRFTPTHSTKNGKRYRYYTSQAIIHHRDAPPGFKRIPAEEIERVVLERVNTLLGSSQELPKLLRKIGLADPARQRTAVAAAQKLVQQSPQPGPHQACRECIERVVLAEDELAIHLSREGLFKVLLGPDTKGIPKRSTGSSQLVLACPFERRRWSNELRLIVPSADSASPTEPTPLLKAIARARQWYERIATGEIHCLEQLAEEHGCTTNYISRLLGLGRLSPKTCGAGCG
jgi:DNA invertase Pin-like site-specific DNA recombinase